MRLALFLLPCVTSAATLTINPPVIYDCTGPYGKATPEWSGASGPVSVVVGPGNAPMTGVSGTSGKAETGNWVGDGLEFRLVNQQGVIEALAVAKVLCGATNDPGNRIVSSSYVPLEVGNTWTYRIDTRMVTSSYITWKVTDLKRGAYVRGGERSSWDVH
jgi:hypothetical protein